MKNLLLTILAIAFTKGLFAQVPDWLWAKSAGGNLNDEAISCSVDSAGNMYMVGLFRSATITFGNVTLVNYSVGGGPTNMFVVKYDPVGNVLWASTPGGCNPTSIVAEASGNVYVVGAFSGSIIFGSDTLTSSGSDMFIVKYDATGNVLWATCSVGGSFSVQANSVTIDASGNVWAAGSFACSSVIFGTTTLTNAGNYGSADIFIVKYDSGGSFLWANRDGGTGGDVASSVVNDSYGSVFIVGSFNSSSISFSTTTLTNVGYSDLFIAKYDANGNAIWANSAGGSSYDNAYSVACDPTGDIFVVGVFESPSIIFGSTTLTTTNADMFIVKYDATGNVLWATNSIGGIYYGPTCSVATDVSGNAYVVGSFGYSITLDSITLFNSTDNLDMFIAKYSGMGNVQWATSALGSSGSNSNFPNSVVTYASSSIYAVGYFENDSIKFGSSKLTNAGGLDVFVAKCQQTANPINGIIVSGNLNFGDVTVGSSSDLPLYLHNNTSSIIHVSDIQFSPIGIFSVLMQNGSDILPNSSLPISVFFFPTAVQTYISTATVYSDAPNGNITFAVTGAGVNNPISWIGFYNKSENNPEISSLSSLDEHYTTIHTDPIKICADGSKATIVKYHNTDASITTSDIVYRMKSDPNGNNTDYTGWFVTPDYTFVNDTVIAKFTHPKYLNVNGLYRKDTIQVVNSQNGIVLYEQAAQIYRAPVVLVHGLWGDMISMLPIHSALLNSGKYNAALLQVADYSNTNSYSFDTNANVIKNNINSALIALRILDYSAGKVDIVAHSMGGDLSRIYLQDDDCGGGLFLNCYRDDIHKLITLNTPHSGTQIANFILSDSAGANLARGVLHYNHMYWNNGAVDDLRCNSPAISSLNGSSLNNHIVPCHSIETDRIAQTNWLTFDEEALANIIATDRSQSVVAFQNRVFDSTPNDLIVPTESQKGGLNDFSYVPNVKHTGSPDSMSVINKIKILLDENPVTSTYFDQNTSGYNPPVIATTFKNDPHIKPNDLQRNGSVTITNPTPGFTCNEGDIVQIEVTGSANINQIIVTAGNINSGIQSLDTTANSATFNYTVPENTIGSIKIMALGFDQTGFVDLDTLEITCNPSVTLDSLKFINDNINIPIDQTIPFTLYGYFSDSTIRDLSTVNTVQYNLVYPNIATLSTDHKLTGNAAGLTILHANYLSKDAYIFVNVYDGTDWVVTSVEEPVLSDHQSSNCFVFPNPTDFSANLFCDMKSNDAYYSIYDLTGRKLLSGQLTDEKATIDLSKLSSGIYIVQAISKDGQVQYQGKIVKE